MRYPPDDATQEPSRRRRSQQPGPGASGQDEGASSVFVPGYEIRREPGPVGHTAGQAATAPARWYGSAADGPAGRGPVRGYPPLPGQPPPTYPPGQFAAWNRSASGRGRHSAAAPPDHVGTGWQKGPADNGSGYYGRDTETDGEPGYSRLAVSDPAADVTSTQTWQAISDGRATGIWTSPPLPRPPGTAAAGPAAGAPAAADVPGAGSRRHAPWSPQAVAQRAAGLGVAADGLTRDSGPYSRPGGVPVGGGPAGGVAAPPGPQARADLATRGDSGISTDQGRRMTAGGGRTSGSHAAGARAVGARAPGSRVARTGPPSAPGAAGPAGDDARGPGPSAGRRGRGRSGQRPLAGRNHPASVKLAVAVALVIVVVAVAAVYLGARAASRRPSAVATTAPRATASAAPSPTASLGPYGHIASRHDDPVPLTLAQLYPASFSVGGMSFALASSRLSADCIDAVAGANIQAAVSASACTQVARATYLSSQDAMMGTIGVFNLQTAQDASKAVNAAGAGNYVLQLPGHSSPTSKLGTGTGIEEATAKGHYLILMWAELTSLARPRTAAERTGLTQFMMDMLQGTANVSLTNRMMDGSPSPAPPGG